MANECIPLFEPGDRLTVDASAAVTGKRFGMISANIEAGPALNTGTAGGNLRAAHATAGALALGVFSQDAAQDKKVTLITGGVVPVTADGSISAGNEVEVGATGKAKIKSAGGQSVGICVADVTDGNDAYVFLLAGTSPGAPGSGNEFAQGTAQPDITDLGAINAMTAPADIDAAYVEADMQALRDDVAHLNTRLGEARTKINSILDVLDEYGMTL